MTDKDKNALTDDDYRRIHERWQVLMKPTHTKNPRVGVDFSIPADPDQAAKLLEKWARELEVQP